MSEFHQKSGIASMLDIANNEVRFLQITENM